MEAMDPGWLVSHNFSLARLCLTWTQMPAMPTPKRTIANACAASGLIASYHEGLL